MRIWWSPQSIADARLPGLPHSKGKIARMIKLENWRAATSTSGEPLARKRKGRGGGFEYHRALVEQAIKDRGHRLLKVSLPLVLYLTQDELARLEAVSAKSKLPVKALALTFVRNGTAMLERIL